MKKIVILVLAMLFSFGANSFAAEYTMKIYNSLPPAFSGAMAGVSLKEKLEKASGGRIDVQYFPTSQLGREQAGLNQIQMGATQAGYISLVELTNQCPRLVSMILPFLFKDYNDLRKFIKTEMSTEMLNEVKKVGLIGLTWDGYGWNNFGTTKPTLTLSDVKKRKIRITTSIYLVDLFKSMGTNPMVIPWPELYTSLQQGTVDGTDHGIELMYLVKFNEVLRHYLVTNHIYGWFMVVVNKDWYEKLPADLQKMVKEVVEETSWEALQIQGEREEEYFKKFEAGGGKITRLSGDERAKFIKATKVLHEKYKVLIGEDFLKKVYKVCEYK